MSREFHQFCTAQGLIIRALRITAPGQTVRVPTIDAPSERKGWYRYDGQRGVCGVWHGLDNGAQHWQPGADAKPLSDADFKRIAANLARAAEAERQKHYAASVRAQRMLKGSEWRSHAYLARKGFPAHLAPCVDDGAKLLVPMYRGKVLVNLQRITEEGEKKFLTGGECIGIVHRIGDAGVPILCEGFATALSVAMAVKACRLRAHVVCCFTAGNLGPVAARYADARVVADNDSHKTGTGEKAAQATGLAYWMPPHAGFDANDYHRKHGLFQLSQRVRELLLTK